MDKYLEMQYFDQDEKPCTLEQMIENEPEWVASRFRHMQKQIDKLQEIVYNVYIEVNGKEGEFLHASLSKRSRS